MEVSGGSKRNLETSATHPLGVWVSSTGTMCLDVQDFVWGEIRELT